ncbi:hypothetical protein ARSEF4850_010052 [Beauveria asiatica]
MSTIITPSAKAASQGDFFWEIGSAEKTRLSDLLSVDFDSLDVKGTFVTSPKRNCRGCGKLSGLDDFVATALAKGIHNKEFMKMALSAEDMAINPKPHYLNCAVCGEPDLEPMAWSEKQKWKA